MTADLYPPELLTELYEGDGLLAKIVDIARRERIKSGSGSTYTGADGQTVC